MKIFIALIAMLALTASAEAQIAGSVVSIFTDEAFTTTDTDQDTSDTYLIGYYPIIQAQMTTEGTDSAIIRLYWDAYIAGKWVNAIHRDTLQLGRPEGNVRADTIGQIDYWTLRDEDSDVFGGATQIRVRNEHAASAGDSVSATSYRHRLILRKN